MIETDIRQDQDHIYPHAVLAGQNGNIIIFDQPSRDEGEYIRKISDLLNNVISSREFNVKGAIKRIISNNHLIFLSGEGENTIEIWDLASGICVKKFQHSDQIYDICPNSSGDGFFIFNKKNIIYNLSLNDLLQLPENDIQSYDRMLNKLATETEHPPSDVTSTNNNNTHQEQRNDVLPMKSNATRDAYPSFHKPTKRETASLKHIRKEQHCAYLKDHLNQLSFKHILPEASDYDIQTNIETVDTYIKAKEKLQLELNKCKQFIESLSGSSQSFKDLIPMAQQFYKQIDDTIKDIDTHFDNISSIYNPQFQRNTIIPSKLTELLPTLQLGLSNALKNISDNEDEEVTLQSPPPNNNPVISQRI